ncbi:diguanylate cyclase [Paraburkholderia sp. BCC1885]|uniref:GGDEF domain-containing protein n=1 Tax=Paraburkholderia sp. BCC1885 TaxID=2562669 RepID=UPI001182FF28|nr:diguanylate cyclase [Paraburkholderia sp. BCC1885]
MPKLTHLVLFAVAFLALHVIALRVLAYQATLVTYPFMVLAPLLACASCLWRATVEERATRSPWILLSAGMALWTCGIVLSAWEEIFQHLPESVAWFSDFTYFLYGVPVLLATSSVSAKQRMPFFIWMDAAQALMTGFLAYVAIFSVLPFSDTPLEPISASTLVLTYNAENCILAAAATLRLFAQPRGRERRFYVVLCSFLWIYAIAAYVYNNSAVQTDEHFAIDALVDVPFLFLTVATMAQRWLRGDVEEAPQKQTLALFIENVSPIFYTVALLVLSISLMRQHFHVGTVGVFTALVVYATRSTTLQGRYIRVQRELHEARDRLEQMALTDALTNTANRRRFDEALTHEWNRAIRNRHPLALLLIDIDYFKMLNDRYGHPAGDRCLVSVALALQSALPRAGDLLARYGGEEFAVILPATDEAGAYLVASAMQAAIQSLKIRNESSTGLFVTVSVGAAVFEAPQTSMAEILEAADQALYRAKQGGRNRIEATTQRDFLRNGTR